MKIHFKILFTSILMLIVTTQFQANILNAGNINSSMLSTEDMYSTSSETLRCFDTEEPHTKDTASTEFLSPASIFSAASFTTTAGATNFNNGSSWVGGNVPPNDGTADITIAHDLTMDIDFTANNLTVEAGQTLTIQAGTILEVTGNITNDGLIYFESDGVNGSAQFDEFTGTISGSGEVTVERFIPAGDKNRKGYRLITSPVSTTGSINANWQEGGLNPGDPGYMPNFGTHIAWPGGSVANGSDQNVDRFFMVNYVNDYNPPASPFLPVFNTLNRTLKAGEPYFTYIRGDRGMDLNDPAATPTNTTLRSTGALHTGDLTYNVGNPEDYLKLSDVPGRDAFIGNPYQSVVDIRKVARTDLTDYIYVWDVYLGDTGGYVTVEAPSDPATLTAPKPGASEASRFIAPGMTFFVQNLNDPATVDPSLTFDEDDKATNESQIDVFNTYPDFYINTRLYKTPDLQNGDRERDALGLRFSSNYSTSPTDEDATKFPNNEESYYSLHEIINDNDISLAIDKRAIPGIGEEINLVIDYVPVSEPPAPDPAPADYSLTFNMANKPDNRGVFLVDNFIDPNNQIEITENFTYNYTSQGTTTTSRFDLVFEEPGDRFNWIAEFDNNYVTRRVFNDALFGSIKTLTVEATSADDEYLIYDNEFSDKWRNFSTPKNQVFTLTHTQNDPSSNDAIMTSPVETGKYYTVQIDGFGFNPRDAVIMETDNPPVDFAVNDPVMPANPEVFPDQALDLTINLKSNKSPQERAFVRYADNSGLNSSEVVEVNFTSDSSGTASIPAGYNDTAGKEVFFYVYTTTVSATDGSNHNLITLKQANNSGANYSYTVNDRWITDKNGDFNDPDTWTANQVPPTGQDITIQHTVNLNVNYSANSVLFQNGGSLNNTTQILSILDDGNITNDNGAGTSILGEVVFDGNGTVTGAVTFNDVDLDDNENSGGVNFNTQSTINGTLTINPGGNVNTGSPIYGPNSTLVYNTGGTYERTSEWSNPNETQGNPHHVILQSNTILDMGANSATADAEISGNLTIQSGSRIEMNGGIPMQGNLIVGGDLINNGTLNASNSTAGVDGSDIIINGNLNNVVGSSNITLSSSGIGNDIYIGGDLTDNGTITYNQRAVFFEGGTTQQINTVSDPYNIDVVRITDGSEVIMNQDLDIDQTNDPLQLFDNSVLDLHGHNLIIGNNSFNSTVSFSGGSKLRGSVTSSLTLKGNGPMGNIPFDQTTDGSTNALGSIYLEKVVGTTVAFNTKVNLIDGISLTSGTLNSNGNLVFLSDDTQTAVVRGAGVGNFNGTINGDVVVHRRFPLTGWQRSFRYISSSVNTASSPKPFIHNNWQEGADDAADLSDPYNDNLFNPEPTFGTHITGAQGTIGQVSADGLDETATGNNSLFTWNDQSQAWSPITNTKTETIDVGSTYALMVRGDRSAPLNSNTAEGDIPATLRTTGTLDLTDFTYTFNAPYNVMDPNEFVLVGNPYQAQVNMIDVLADLGTIGIDPNYLWVWDPTLTDKGAYAVVDLSNPGSPEDIDGLPSMSQANQYLQPFQAVFVQVDAGPSQTVQFQRDDIDNSAPQTTVFSTTNTSKIEIELYNSQNSLLLDAVRLQFDPTFDNAKTFEDAAKFWNNDEYLAIINSNSYLSIDKRDLPQVNDTIPLLLGNYQTSQYTLQLESTLDANIQAQLYDHYLDQTLDLANGNNTYDFTIDTSIPESTDNQRFELIFNPQTLGTVDPLRSTFFKVYPNPAEDILYIQSSSKLLGQDVEMTCFDQLGRMVLSQIISNLEANTSLDLSTLSAGLYLLKLETEGHQETFKIQVK